MVTQKFTFYRYLLEISNGNILHLFTTSCYGLAMSSLLLGNNYYLITFREPILENRTKPDRKTQS